MLTDDQAKHLRLILRDAVVQADPNDAILARCFELVDAITEAPKRAQLSESLEVAQCAYLIACGWNYGPNGYGEVCWMFSHWNEPSLLSPSCSTPLSHQAMQWQRGFEVEALMHSTEIHSNVAVEEAAATLISGTATAKGST